MSPNMAAAAALDMAKKDLAPSLSMNGPAEQRVDSVNRSTGQTELSALAAGIGDLDG